MTQCKYHQQILSNESPIISPSPPRRLITIIFTCINNSDPNRHQQQQQQQPPQPAAQHQSILAPSLLSSSALPFYQNRQRDHLIGKNYDDLATSSIACSTSFRAG